MGRCADSLISHGFAPAPGRTYGADTRPNSTVPMVLPMGEKLDHDTYAKHRRTLTHLPRFYSRVLSKEYGGLPSLTRRNLAAEPAMPRAQRESGPEGL